MQKASLSTLTAEGSQPMKKEHQNINAEMLSKDTKIITNFCREQTCPKKFKNQIKSEFIEHRKFLK